MPLKMELKAVVCALLLGDLNVCLLKKARITVGTCRGAPFQLDRSEWRLETALADVTVSIPGMRLLLQYDRRLIQQVILSQC